MKKDGHPRLAHFAIFVLAIVATTFGVTNISNQSLPGAEAQYSGLTHYWKMDEDINPSVPEIAIADSVGNVSAYGDWSGYVSWVPNGKNKGAVKFSGGPGGSLDLSPTDPSFKVITPPWSFTAWIKLIARSSIRFPYGGDDAPIFASQNSVPYCGLQIMIENESPTYELVFDVMDCMGGQGPEYRKTVTSSVPVPHGNFGGGNQTLVDENAPWAHIAVVAKGPPDANRPENVRLYIDGIDRTGIVSGSSPVIEAMTPPYGPFPSRTDLYLITAELGSRLSGSGGYFHGYMDEVKIYNKALSPSEVRYSAGISCGNNRCERSYGENFLNCWKDCPITGFKDL